MTLTIELTPEEEAKLRVNAQAQGKPVAAYLHSLIASLPDSQAELARAQYEATTALFQEWEAEDADMTTEEIAAEQAEWERFKANVNAARAATGERRIYP